MPVCVCSCVSYLSTIAPSPVCPPTHFMPPSNPRPPAAGRPARSPSAGSPAPPPRRPYSNAYNRPLWGEGEGIDWGGDTSGYYTKPQKTIQSPDRQYKAPTDNTKPQKDNTKT